MTQEQIQKAATEYAIGKTHYRRNILGQVNMDNYSLRKNDCIDDFIDGAKWRINSVWHDRSETPKFGCPILGITIFGEPIIDGPFGIQYDVDIDMSNIKKWAYIKDLMPNE